MERKILGVLRVSTDSQDVASQKAEMVEFAKELGYKEEQIQWLEFVGASAWKRDEKYLRMIEEVKKESLKTKCVFAWATNRFARREEYLHQLIAFFEENQIQCYIKTPFVKLLNDDGKVDVASRTMFTMFALLNRIETEELKAKMRRGRKYKEERGQFVGGVIPFGYRLENDRFVVEEKEAEIVRRIFAEYNANKKSVEDIVNDLNNMGLTLRGKAWNRQKLFRVLNLDWLLGNDRLPRIIDRSDWDGMLARKGLRNHNDKEVDTLCYKLIQCPHCGKYFSHNALQYKCYCEPPRYVKINKLDKAVWWLTLQRNATFEREERDVMLKEAEITIKEDTLKLEGLKKQLQKVEEKKERIDEVYIEDGNKEKRQKSLSKALSEERTIKGSILDLESEIRRLNALKSDVYEHKEEVSAVIDSYKFTTLEQKKRIVQRHVKRITPNYEGDKTLKTKNMSFTVFWNNGTQDEFVVLLGRQKLWCLMKDLNGDLRFVDVDAF